MRSRNFGLYAVALAAVVVGALWAGLPVASLGYFAFILVCPLMMFFMMRGMHGGQHGQVDDGASDRPVPHDHGDMR